MQDFDFTQPEFYQTVIDLCEEAGRATLEVYEHKDGITVHNKEDSSPLTEADMRSNQILVEGLHRHFPSIPVISEELEIPAFAQRQTWSSYWLIDPLDGTKEFVSGSGEFTVNVALIKNNRAVFGVVCAPVLATTYYGISGVGAAKIINGEKTSIHTRELQRQIREHEEINVVASKRHGNEKVDVFLQKIEHRLAKIKTANIGSSLKICLLAEGSADFYPRLAPTCEWDIAAAHAVLHAAGGEIYDHNAEPFTYNTKEALLNSDFFAVADCSYPWQDIIVNS